jgi:endoglucanase
MFTGAQFQLKSGSNVLATMTVPNTGNFQSWQTITAQINLPAGTQTLRIQTTAANGGWNLNWWEISCAENNCSGSSHIEGEDYSAMNGIQLENTSDVGGGQNVAWQDDGDWMDYSVNIATAGTYTVQFRVASMFTGAQFQLKSGSNVLATITVPNTGNFQSWQTINTQINLPAGAQTLRIQTTACTWWMES